MASIRALSHTNILSFMNRSFGAHKICPLPMMSLFYFESTSQMKSRFNHTISALRSLVIVHSDGLDTFQNY